MNNIYAYKIYLSFVAQEIEADQLSTLTEEDLKIVIPNIGPRRKFQKNLKIYLDEVFTIVYYFILLFYNLVTFF